MAQRLSSSPLRVSFSPIARTRRRLRARWATCVSGHAGHVLIASEKEAPLALSETVLTSDLGSPPPCGRTWAR